MGNKLLKIFILQGLILKVLTSFTQPAIKQYLLTGVNQPVSNIPPGVPYQPPPTGLSSLSSLSLPTLVSLLSQTTGNNIPIANANFPPPPPKVLPSTLPPALPSSPPTSQGIDSSVLNNLAIAVQLLVLNNILNAPEKSESMVEVLENVPVGKPSSAYTKKPEASFESFAMPNANFVGSSGFESPMLGSSTIFPYGSPPPISKSSMSLMSPYEALGPNSPYSDPILSSYGSVSSRNSFQSPYSAMDNDLFAMNDFY